MSADWVALTLAYLHDPPDKALSIRAHERRSAALASIALGEPVATERLHGDTRSGDILAAMIERVPMPTAGEAAERVVEPTDGRLTVVHPLSAAPQVLDVRSLDREAPGELL